MRITGDGRCVDKWHRHIETLAHRVEKLNQLNFKSLHYTNCPGDGPDGGTAGGPHLGGRQ